MDNFIIIMFFFFFFWGYRFFRVAKPRCPLPFPPAPFRFLWFSFVLLFVCLFVSFLLWFCFCQPFSHFGSLSLSSPLLSSLVFLLHFCCFFSVFLHTLHNPLVAVGVCIFVVFVFQFTHSPVWSFFPFHGFASLLFCNPSFWFCWLYAIEPDFFPSFLPSFWVLI